jgi:hypothetical protein
VIHCLLTTRTPYLQLSKEYFITMFLKSSIYLLLLLLAIATVSTTTAETDLEPRCGDCWCIPGNDGLDECPSAPDDGIVDTFNLTDAILWSTFLVTNDEQGFLTLDEGCYPFADAVGPTIGFPESNGPQCTLPVDDGDGVCAYKFTDVDTCADRPYEVLTYDSLATAEADGAVLTHTGGTYVHNTLNLNNNTTPFRTSLYIMFVRPTIIFFSSSTLLYNICVIIL